MRRLHARLAAVLVLVGAAGQARCQEPLRFLHISDLHLPREPSENLVPRILAAGQDAGAGFCLVTGDITEFGGRDLGWPRYRRLFAKSEIADYPALGNHDVTWDGLSDQVAARFGQRFYAFTRGGVRFHALSSAGIQDPRPMLGEEQIRFVEADLAKLPADTPIVAFCHHPPDSDEFATRYEPRRLLAAYAGRELLAVLVGHGHNARAGHFLGRPWAMGGSTFGPNAGYALVEIGAERLRHEYRFELPDKRPKVLLDRRRQLPALRIAALEPADRCEARGDTLRVGGRIEGGTRIEATVTLAIDDGAEEPVALDARGGFARDVDLGALAAGAHSVFVAATRPSGEVACAVRRFYVDRPSGPLRLVFRRYLGAGLQGQPLVTESGVVVTTNDGRVVVLDTTTGEVRHETQLGAPLPGGAAVAGDGTVLVGGLDGKTHALRGSRILWESDLGSPIAAAPVVVGALALFADLRGHLTALGRQDGSPKWQQRPAAYAIEKAPALTPDGLLLAGAWDTKVHCLRAADGHKLWELRARGARAQAARYYSPADCPPVWAADRFFVTDRAFELTVIDAAGNEVGGVSGVAAASASPSGDAVYLRTTEKGLVRLDPRTLATEWQAALPLGRTPAPPTAGASFVVALGERDGCAYAVDAATGTVLGSYRLNPGLYPLAPVAVAGQRVYAGDLDGNVTALEVVR